MKPLGELQLRLIEDPGTCPEQVGRFPRFRYMGSKFRLLPWLCGALGELPFETATDAFSGSGVVSYLMKSMGKQVRSNDTLAFPSVLTSATIANNATRLETGDLEPLLASKARKRDEKFIRSTFEGIFYTPQELSFLDDLWAGIREMNSPA